MAHHPRVPHTAFDIVCPSKVLPMENSPHLRIDLSTRNHMIFLTGCLQGCVTQPYTDFEFHIADKAPTDRIYEACHCLS
jgi:hypothetical protein